MAILRQTSIQRLCFLFFRYADQQQYEETLKRVAMYFFSHKISSQEEAKSFVVKAVLGNRETVHVEQYVKFH